MQNYRFSRWLSLLWIVMFFQCKPEPTDLFEGRVIDFKDQGIPEAEVEINGSKTKSQSDGRFVLKLKKSSATKFLINVRKDGFATYSQAVTAPSKKLVFTLYEATVVSADPTKEIKVTDTNSKNRPGPRTASANWASNPMAAVPLVVRNNKIVDLGFPANFGKSFEYLLNRKPGEGISITIPANSLVSAVNQNAPSGNVSVAVSTIDIYSPNAMPGDFQLIREGRDVGFLISYGAGFIDVYDGTQRYQLKKGAAAQITIPVDGSQLVYGDSIPTSIPLYLFDEKAGAWVDHGKASLSADKKSYVGEVRHFSTFNVDIEKATPACLGFQYIPTAAAPAGYTYNVEILAPSGGTIIHKTRTVTEPGDCPSGSLGTGAHVILRLPPSTDTGLIFIDPANNPLAVIVTQSSPSYDPSNVPVCTPAGYENSGAAVSCPSVTWDVISSPLIAVGLTNTMGAKQIKWVYKNATPTTTYSIFSADGTCISQSAIMGSNRLSTPLSIGGLVLEQIDIPSSSTGNFKVRATDGATVVESACVAF